MHQQFQSVNPFREPSWRFQRVLDLVERERPGRCTQRDDDYIKEYRRFVGKLRRNQDPEDQMSIFPKFPGLFLAHLWYHHPDKENNWMLQSWILTGESNEYIGQQMCLIPSAVEWYERIFFNVRDRLLAPYYIVKRVIGRLDDRGSLPRDGKMSEFQSQMSYKLFGYFGGPFMLQAIFAGYVKTTQPNDPDALDDWIDDTFRRGLRTKSVTAIRHLEVDKWNVMQLFELHARLIEATNAESGASTNYERNVKAVLENLPFELAEARRKRTGSPFAISAVEPRVDEMIMLSKGKTPSKLERDKKLRILPPGVD